MASAMPDKTEPPEPAAPDGQILIYQDGATRLQVRLDGRTVWLTQGLIAELFQTTKQNVSLHLRNIFAERELEADSVVKESLTTAADGKRYRTLDYNLDAILAVGYRVRSARGTAFRQWATARLSELLVKGFTLDDERLKEGRSLGTDYFDELLERIRAIRASERMFYQKITDIYASSIDYDAAHPLSQTFFATVQNKLHFAIHGRTAAEVIKGRADAVKPNMGMTTWKNAPRGPIRKADVTVAKNYLSHQEIEELDRIVVMYLDFAEDQAKRRKAMSMGEWQERLDAFLTFNEREVLTNAGKLRADVVEKLALEHYEQFDVARRMVERAKADARDVEELVTVEKRLRCNNSEKKQ